MFLQKNPLPQKWSQDLLMEELAQGSKRPKFIKAVEQTNDKIMNEEAPDLILAPTPDALYEAMQAALVEVFEVLWPTGASS